MAGEGEFARIERLFAPLSDAPHGLNLKDDVGLIPDLAGQGCIAADMIVSGVHFLPDDPGDLIARKLVRVNVSDIVAKGARPRACLLTAAFNGDRDAEWIDAFAAGLAPDLSAYGLVLVGGDTVRTPGPDCFSMTMVGEAAPGGLVKRAGARPGDGLYVTGTIGDAGLGLKILLGDLGDVALGQRTPLVDRYRLPNPRVGFGEHLAKFASAALDVSDGLVADAGHLAQASGGAIRIELDRVPISSSAKRLVAKNEALRVSLLGLGDDYEILFAAPPDAAALIAEASGDSDTPVTRIGTVHKGPIGQVDVYDSQGGPVPLPRAGYQHF